MNKLTFIHKQKPDFVVGCEIVNNNCI